MAILYGLGAPTLTTVIDGQQRLLAFEPVDFELASNVETVKSKKFAYDGTVVNAGSAKRSVEWTLKMGVEAINWHTIQIAMGELSQTATDVTIGQLRYATLPLTGAQTITDADIPADATKVTAAVYGNEEARSLARVSGTPGTGQFSVAAGTITVGPGHEGKTIGYRLLLTEPTVDSIGVISNPTLINQFSFEGILKTDSRTTATRIYVPQLSSESSPVINVQGVTKFDLTYTLVVPAGKTLPFEMYEIPLS